MRTDPKPLAAVLAVGIVLGAGLMRVVDRRPFGRGRMVQHLARRLHLSEGQRKDVEKIVEDKRRKLDALRDELHPRFEDIRESARVEIRKLLDPVQQAEFDRMDAEFKARHKQHRHPDGPPPPP
ncbi:MAG: hypothetical protein HY925_06820 [Elusimicrobia bacterium]|nr:hypothetical protein [Elusimicrobiota bacterium]